MASATDNLLPATMNSAGGANLTATDLTKILQGDPSAIPMVSWLLQGGNVNTLGSAAEQAALSSLIKDPATAKLANLGVQAMNGVDVTKSLESMLTQSALQSLNLNQDQTNLANVGLMAAMGATPMGWAMEGLSLGQQYLPELFGGPSTQFAQDYQMYSAPRVSTDGSYTEYPHGRPNPNQAPGQPAFLPVYKDNTTGKVYSTFPALEVDRDTATYKSQGYSDTMAKNLAIADNAQGLVDSGAVPKEQMAAFQTKVNDQISKIGGNLLRSSDQLGYLPTQLKALAALTDPSAPQDAIQGAMKSTLSAIQNMDLSNENMRNTIIDRVKSTFGGLVPKSISDAVQAKYKQDLTAYQQNYIKDPATKAIVDKYTAAGAKPPAPGSSDSIVMAKYLGAPQSVINDLTKMVDLANPQAPSTYTPPVNPNANVQLNLPYPTPANDEQRAANYQAAQQQMAAAQPQTQQTQSQQTTVTPQQAATPQSAVDAEKSLAAAKASNPDVNFGNITPAQWMQMSPDKQAAFADEIRHYDSIKNSLSLQAAGQPAVVLPFSNPTTDEQRAANLMSSYDQTASMRSTAAQDDRLKFYLGLGGMSVDEAVAAFQAEGNSVTPGQQQLINSAKATKAAPAQFIGAPQYQQTFQAPVAADPTKPAYDPTPIQQTAADKRYAFFTKLGMSPEEALAGVQAEGYGQIPMSYAPTPTPTPMTAVAPQQQTPSIAPVQEDPTAARVKKVGNDRLSFLMSLNQSDPNAALREYQQEGFTLTPDQQIQLNPSSIASAANTGVQLAQSPMASADPTKGP